MSKRQVVKFGSIEDGSFVWNGEWRIGEGETWTEIVSDARRQYRTTVITQMVQDGATDEAIMEAANQLRLMTAIGDEVM